MSSFTRVVEHVFGTNFLSPENMDEYVDLDSSICVMEMCSDYSFSGIRSQGSGKKAEGIKIDHEDGRVGNSTVSLDISELSNRILYYDILKIIGESNFGTVKTNCGVCRGKWQYEVVLLSNGIMQIGWATSNSEFGYGQGVGDTSDSFAFDGSRIRKWNVLAEGYGEKWEEDDIIGCCIDLDDGCVEFFRNGTSLGVAYRDIPMGAGILYFPTISLQQKEGLIPNFGSSPFCYPVSGCQPIQDPPRGELAAVTYLLDCISKLISLMDSHAITPETSCDGVGTSYEAMLLEIAKILVLNITPILKIPYVMETKFVPFIHMLCESENSPVAQSHSRPSARTSVPKNVSVGCTFNNRRLDTFLDLLWTFSEESELKIWTSTLVSRLSVKFQHNVRPLLLDFSAQKESIYILRCLLHHKSLRHYLMNHVLFEGVKFPWFLNIKVPSAESFTFWETEPSIQMNKCAFMTSITRITTAMNSLEDMQINLLMVMMDDTDGSEGSLSSKNIFLTKFRVLRRQLYALYRVDPLKSPGGPLCLVWPLCVRLSRLLELLWAREAEVTRPDFIPPSKFYDGSIPYYDMDRLGGVLLYLLKTYHNDLEKRLGASQRAHLTAQVFGNGSSRPVAESSSKSALLLQYIAPIFPCIFPIIYTVLFFLPLKLYFRAFD
ncbi:hypothetical protein ONE63_010478 [Megalurothrips usitatus]|uniref:B30.2/SPRY domain-containing protein n=1 Tax=Megalurothrips usitatus TaxID=439358 RepID=A0AAV7XJW4_9NEOP|nr:hypothetical protein ONE63_010478 [Megalurothrips usitatus]